MEVERGEIRNGKFYFTIKNQTGMIWFGNVTSSDIDSVVEWRSEVFVYTDHKYDKHGLLQSEITLSPNEVVQMIMSRGQIRLHQNTCNTLTLGGAKIATTLISLHTEDDIAFNPKTNRKELMCAKTIVAVYYEPHFFRREVVFCTNCKAPMLPDSSECKCGLKRRFQSGGEWRFPPQRMTTLDAMNKIFDLYKQGVKPDRNFL